MKRFYSLMATAILALVTMTVSAQVKSVDASVVVATQADGTLTRVENVQKQVRSIDFSNVKMQRNAETAKLQVKNSPSKVPAKAGEKEGTWTTLGTAKYTEDCLATFFNIGDVTVEVEIEESDVTPGMYRMANPYIAVKAITGGTILDGADDYWYIHAEDPNKVWTETFNSGFRPTAEYGNMVIYSYVGYLLGAGQTPSDAQYGKLSEGVITFPEKKLLINWPNYTGTSLKNTSLYYGNTNGKFKVSMPGAKDYSISVSTAACAAENKVLFTIETGADVAGVKYLYQPQTMLLLMEYIRR